MKQETGIEEIAERIARHHLDSERVSVTQFCDIAAEIAKALHRERGALNKAIQSAFDDLQSEHVTPNLFRLGVLGKQDVERAVKRLKAIREER